MLNRFGSQRGDALWSVPYRDAAAAPSDGYWPTDDATMIADDTLYTLARASDRGKAQRSLVTAEKYRDGDIVWTAIVNGNCPSCAHHLGRQDIRVD